MIGRRVRLGTALLVVAAMVALVVPVAPAGAGRERPTPGFADGEWIGDAVSGFGFTVDGGVGGSTGGGTFSLHVDGGSITSGAYEASAVGEAVTEAGQGQGTLTASGTITGAADEPIIENVMATLDGTLTVGGITIPFVQDFGGGSMVMTILSASCSVVIGTVEPEVRARVEGSVNITNLSSRFVATRVAERGSRRAEDFGIEITSLIVEGDEVVADAADGSIDVTRFLDLLLRAERLAESLPRNARCTTAGATSHLSTVASVVANLLEVIIANPDLFGATEMQVALEAAVRTGLAGPDGRPDLIADMQEVVGDEIAEAADAGDDVAVMRLGAAASMMGWTREARAAADYAEGAGS